MDEKAIDCLFQLIEIGLFPCLRIIDFYSIHQFDRLFHRLFIHSTCCDEVDSMVNEVSLS